METQRFLNKQCKLVLNNGFVLYGIVKGIDQYGIIFETKQKTTYQSFLNIKELSEDDFL
jgi:sRNA-binding regulator protein Hfq